MNSAIIELSGKQIWVEKGKFYDVNKINSSIGSRIKLYRILFISIDNKINLGQPYINKKYITCTILKHFNSSKIIVYKMKPKKKCAVNTVF